jgi:hypothetical protein
MVIYHNSHVDGFAFKVVQLEITTSSQEYICRATPLMKPKSHFSKTVAVNSVPAATATFPRSKSLYSHMVLVTSLDPGYQCRSPSCCPLSRTVSSHLMKAPEMQRKDDASPLLLNITSTYWTTPQETIRVHDMRNSQS